MDTITDYDNFVVKKGTIRYKYIFILFLLCLFFFHPETYEFVRENFKIENTNVLLFLHSGLFVSFVYIMLVYSGDSYIFSPCNIELDIDDYRYYQNKNIFNNIDETDEGTFD
jgi:hypothetical protein